MLPQTPESFEHVFRDVRSHLGAGTPSYTRFLTLAQRILFNSNNPHYAEQSILDLAEILKAHPRAFYHLNRIFHPHGRVEFNIRRSPITSFVIKTPNSSRIIVLSGPGDHLALNTLSSTQFGDILSNGKSGSHTYCDLQALVDPALQDCFAQLAQDLLDDTRTPKSVRKRALAFLRRGIGVPPSLLLHELTQHDMFAGTTFSDLYEGTVGTIKVIIKKPRVCKGSLNNKEIIREITLCRQFCHPNILPFQGVSFDAQDRLYGLVTRFMKNGNITDFLRRNPDTNRLTCVWQIMNGLRFLHAFDPPVAHRDIKGANILVDDNFVCRLCDFGLSSIPELSQRSRERAVGTLSWMSPEMFLSSPTQIEPFKADIYALAITVIEIYAGGPPPVLSSCTCRCPTNSIRKENLSLKLQEDYALPPYLSELTSMMLDPNPSERPPIDMICLAVEDNLEFPKRIVISGDAQGSNTMTPDSSAHIFAKHLAQEWVERELERERKLAKEPVMKYTSLQRISIPRNRTDPPSHATRPTRPPSRLALLRQATTYRSTSALSNHEPLHGMPTPLTDDSRSPSVVPPDVSGISTSWKNPDTSYPLTPQSTSHSTVKMPQAQPPTPGHTLYPRDLARLIIPPNPPRPGIIAIPTQTQLQDPEESPDPLSSATTPKRSRWSPSDDEDESRQGITTPSVVQRFHQDQVARDVRSPSPSKRRRQESSSPSSPISLSGRIVDAGVSTH